MKITNFNRQNLAILDEEIKKALAPVLAKYGVELDPSPGSFSDTEFNKKLKFKVAGSINPLEELYLKQNGLSMGMEFTNGTGQKCSITGYNTKAHKMPVNYKNLVDGKNYKTTKEMIKFYIKNKK